MPTLQERYETIGNYYNAREIYPLYDGDDLGVTYSPEKTTFKVWAPSAVAVSLNLYRTGSDVEQGSEKVITMAMVKDNETGVWSICVKSDLKGLYYTYSVLVDGVMRETQDVYSKAVGVNGNRSMILDMKETNPEGWSKDKHVFVDNPTDAVIWEVHVRDFSISKSSGVEPENRGKYLAFTQRGTKVNKQRDVSSCVEYLVEQGINYVHLNPVFDFGSIDEAMHTSQYNWGYDPVTDTTPGAKIQHKYGRAGSLDKCRTWQELGQLFREAHGQAALFLDLFGERLARVLNGSLVLSQLVPLLIENNLAFV